MKQNTKALWSLGLAALLTAVFAMTALAGCPIEQRECYANAGQGAYLGRAACRTCWQWNTLTCEFCRGYADPASRCNNKYPACQGNCWSCNGGRGGCCLDGEGNRHGACDNLAKLKHER